MRSTFGDMIWDLAGHTWLTFHVWRVGGKGRDGMVKEKEVSMVNLTPVAASLYFLKKN